MQTLGIFLNFSFVYYLKHQNVLGSSCQPMLNLGPNWCSLTGTKSAWWGGTWALNLLWASSPPLPAQGGKKLKENPPLHHCDKERASRLGLDLGFLGSLKWRVCCGSQQPYKRELSSATAADSLHITQWVIKKGRTTAAVLVLPGVSHFKISKCYLRIGAFGNSKMAGAAWKCEEAAWTAAFSIAQEALNCLLEYGGKWKPGEAWLPR